MTVLTREVKERCLPFILVTAIHDEERGQLHLMYYIDLPQNLETDIKATTLEKFFSSGRVRAISVGLN